MNARLPFRKRPVVEELEPRLLYSADLSPLHMLAADSGSEIRLLETTAPPTAAPSESVQTPAEKRHEVVIIDGSLSNWSELLADLPTTGDDRTLDIALLDPRRDGLQQISEILAQFDDLAAVHLVSHGASGEIVLGNRHIDQRALQENGELLQRWGQSLSDDGDLLLYGCEVAEGAAGQSFVQELARLTAADVAASTDTTGADTLGGDWQLETTAGRVDAISLTAVTWNGLLAANTAPTFVTGGSGIITTAMGSGADAAEEVIVQSDGKYIVVGRSNNGTDDDFAIARYNSDGSLDTTFSGDGKTTVAIGSGLDQALSAAVQSDGKIVVIGVSYNGANNDFAVVRLNADGSLDTSFSGDGITTTDILASTDNANSVLIQSDGKIVVTGSALNGASYDYAAVRYNTNGSLDTTFSGDGKVTTSFNTNNDVSRDSVLQSDGKIVLVGSSNTVSSDDFSIVRYNADGTLDTTFSGDGLQTVAFGGTLDVAHTVALQADGKIVLAGRYFNGTSYAMAIARLGTTGTLDTTFSGDGMQLVDVSANTDAAYSVAVQSDGAIVLAGPSGDGVTDDFAVVRLTSAGALDTTFSGDGMLTTSLGSGLDQANSVALLSDGRIVAAGLSSNGANNDFAVVRYGSTGTVDTTLGGTNTLNGAPTFTEGGAAVVLDADVQVYDNELSAGNFSGATLTLTRNGGANSQDVFSASGTLAALTQGGNLTVDGTTIGTVTTNSNGTLLLTFNASATNALVNSAMQKIAYSNSGDAPPASVQLDWTFSDGNTGAQGTGGALSASGSTTVSITAVNDAPVLANTALTLTVGEDAGAPSGAVGALISAFTGGITDPDGAVAKGIAITATVETNGVWWYSTNSGSSWATVGTVNATSSLLLADDGNTRLYFAPAAGYSGTATSALTLRAWDQTSGSAGSKVNTSSTGGTTAFSTATDVIDVKVGAPGIAVVRGVHSVGNEIRVNTTTTDLQAGPNTNASNIAADSAGNYVVVWQSMGQDAAGNWGIYGQRYNAAGVAQGSEFLINQTATGSQSWASVAMAADGKFTVVWYSDQTTSGDIYMRRYAADGTALSDETRVNTTTTGTQKQPDIAMDASGNAVVVWEGRSGANYDIYAQRYNSSGVAQGSELTVNTTTTGDQTLGVVTMNAAGQFLVTWTSSSGDGSGAGIYGQRYDAAGATQGGQFLINQSTTNDQLESDAAMDANGGFVVVWGSAATDAGNIFMRRYDSGGTALSGEVQVNTTGTDYQGQASIGMDSHGNYIVAWSSNAQDGNLNGVYARRYSAGGVALGGEFQVNQSTTGDQYFANVLFQPNGDFIIAWEGAGSTDSDSGVFLRRYSVQPVTTEAGGTASFQVVLNSAPSADVTISLSSSDATEATLSTSSLTFTSANWSTPQTVTITGVDDLVADGNVTYTVVTGAASSADVSFSGTNATDLTGTNLDNETYNTLLVDTTSDVADGDSTNVSTLLANKGADGFISLREAIIAANNTANGNGGADRIYFNIGAALVGGAHTIHLTSALPDITDKVTIDGSSEPDWTTQGNRPVVRVDGAGIGPSGDGFGFVTGSDGSVLKGLSITGFPNSAVWLYNTSNITVQGNYIGLATDGTAAGSANGILIEGSDNNLIGGTTAAQRNVIGASVNYQGVWISNNSDYNVVQGNYIGVGVDGSTARGNAANGVLVEIGSTHNTIGGTDEGAGNVISGNLADGIKLNVSANDNIVQGNIIGLNAAGTAALGNGGGIGIANASHNTIIGGTAARAGNVISGNTGTAIWLEGSNGAIIQGNRFGTTADGSAVLTNGSSHIMLNASGNNVIGGATAAAGNLIVGSPGAAIWLADTNATGNLIEGNTIGTDAGLTQNWGNGVGVRFTGPAHDNMVRNNVIAHSAFNGIRLSADVGAANAFLGNRIWDSVGVGIDLGEDDVTPNDPAINLDADAGPNNLQNFPVLITAATTGSTLAVRGSLDAAANTTYRLEFFNNPLGSENATGYGEGKYFLFAVDVTTNASGHVEFDLAPQAATVALDDRVSATATVNLGGGIYGSTSEFSMNLPATSANSAPVLTVPGAQSVNEDTALTLSGISVADADSNLSSVQLTVGNGTLTVDLTGGASIAAGANGSATLTLAGTQAQINTVLGTLRYQGNANYAGSDTLTVIATDSAAASDTETVALTVNPVNDAPTTFGRDGVNVVWSYYGEGTAQDQLVLGDGRTVITAAGWSGVIARVNDDGTLDSSFGGSGVIDDQFPNGPLSSWASRTAAQADGKLVVVGGMYNGATSGGVIGRYNTDGSVDTSFGNAGFIVWGAEQRIGALAIQADGKILVAGHDLTQSEPDTLISRYNTDGSLDASFGTNGTVRRLIAPQGAVLHDMLLRPDGKIILAGDFCDAYRVQFGVAQLNADGSTDTTFGNNGASLLAMGTGEASVKRLLRAADGSLLLVGGAVNGSALDVAMARFNADGSLDTSFGAGGKAIISVDSADDLATGVALQADGRIVLAGYARQDSSRQAFMLRCLANGAADTSFAANGVRMLSLGNGYDEAAAVTVLPDGTLQTLSARRVNDHTEVVLTRYDAATGFIVSDFDPVASNTLDGAPTFIEGGRAVVLDGTVSVFDAELTAADSFNGATLTLARAGGANAQDVFSASGTLAALTQGGNLTVGGTTIGTVTTNSGGTLVLTFNASATNARVNSTLQQIAYSNSSDTPPASAQIDWTFSDGNSGSQGTGGAMTATGHTTVSITAVNDAPVLANTALTLTVAEDAGAPSGAVGSLVSAFTGGISDADSGAVKGIAITATNETNGTWYYSINGGTSWSAVGTVSATQSLLLADDGNT
ncbi:MAG: DUF4347 domain-containing protein, partial [Candidatus Accumulibacter sp.]|nr:DUF4347 domain-containing protein [Accumulibacter sp.]